MKNVGLLDAQPSHPEPKLFRGQIASPSSARRSVVRGLMESSRLALLVGFGGLLSIMCLAGVDALRVVQQFRRSDDQIRSRYLAQNHVLNDIRSDVYLSGTYVRDYLLEPESGKAEGHRFSLIETRSDTDNALAEYRRLY